MINRSALHKKLDGTRKHQLMTEELQKTIPPLYANEEVKDPLVVAKFFSPYSSSTWYVTEFDGEDTMFGYADLGYGGELGYISLTELAELHRKGLPLVERDLYWKPVPLSTVKEKHGG